MIGDIVAQTRDVLAYDQWNRVHRLYEENAPQLRRDWTRKFVALFTEEQDDAPHMSQNQRNRFYRNISKVYLEKRENDYFAAQVGRIVGENTFVGGVPLGIQQLEILMFVLNRRDSVALKEAVSAIHLLN